jgi:hypothetical protein
LPRKRKIKIRLDTLGTKSHIINIHETQTSGFMHKKASNSFMVHKKHKNLIK